jgi:hypothetical protein
MLNYNVTKKIETSAAHISLCDDGIVRVLFKKKVEIDIIRTKENHEAYNKLVENKKYAFLFYAEDGDVIYTNEAGKYSRSMEEAYPKTCIAVLVKTLGHRLIANFYLKINKPKVPFMVFNNLKDAEAWCIKECRKNTLEKKVGLKLY